jgi:hypothetical protein
MSSSPPVNPNDLGRGPLVIGVLWALTSLAVLVVAARLYLRKVIGALGWDDFLILIAMVRFNLGGLPDLQWYMLKVCG